MKKLIKAIICIIGVIVVLMFLTSIYHTDKAQDTKGLLHNVLDKLEGKDHKEVKTSEDDQALIDIKHDKDNDRSNVIQLNKGKTHLTTNDKKLLNKKGQKHFWAKYSKPDQLGRSEKVHALVTPQSVHNHSSSVQKRPQFKSNVGVSGEYKDGSYDTQNQTWRGHQSNNKQIHTDDYNGWLYNKSHTFAWSLGGNMETENVTLGTRDQNIGDGQGGMSYSENKVRDAVKHNKKARVYYVADPVYKGSELVPRGSHVRAYSVNDDGKTINLNVWVPNDQPDIKINYKNGQWSYDKAS